jgi:hypothetical protein
MYFDLFLLTFPLWGGDMEETAVTQMDSVLVTANKVEEDAQKIPQSITVMDEFLLEDKGITDVPDVGNSQHDRYGKCQRKRGEFSRAKHLYVHQQQSRGHLYRRGSHHKPVWV